MSRYYGTLRDERGQRTKCGYDSITAAAQTYDGSVITGLEYDKRGVLYVDVSIADGSCAYGRTIYHGTFEHYVKALKKAMEEGR